MFVKEDVVQVSSSVRPVDCVSQKVTCVMVTMTVETSPMKETVDMVNATALPASTELYCRNSAERRIIFFRNDFLNQQLASKFVSSGDFFN